MKILLISFSHHATLQNYMYLLKKNLAKNSVDVYSLGNEKISTLYDTLPNTYLYKCTNSPTPSFNNLKYYIRSERSIKSKIKEIRPDVTIFTSKHIWNFLLLPALKRSRSKIIHVFHDPVGHADTSVSKGVLIYNKILAKFLSGIIVHSQKSYNDTLKYIKPKCPVVNIPLGEKKWLEYQMPTEFKYKLLIFGRISTYKGYEFIPAIAKKLKQANINCQLVVAGKSLDDVNKTLIDEIHAYDNVLFRDEYIEEKELDSFYYSCDASLILHKSISQSGVITDAYRHGHPIICFDIDGISEFITEKTAYKVRPFDIDGIISDIKRLYDSFDNFKMMSQEAYIFGKEKFSETKMAEETLKFVEEQIKA